MKASIFNTTILILLLSLLLTVVACSPQNKSVNQQKEGVENQSQLPERIGAQLGEYITGIFEDSKGNLWISTIANGLAKYDGNKLVYVTSHDVWIGRRFGKIVEDTNGNLWLGAHSGVFKYDGKTFKNFTVDDGLCDNLVTDMLIDKAGTLWVGTWGGVCKFDGDSFHHFPLPTPDVELLSYQVTTDWIREIAEDSKGNIWFGRDGYGAVKYDGEAFTHFTKKDGLASNSVTDIQEDNQGDIWFSSRIVEKDHPDSDQRLGPGGLVKYNGEATMDFPELEGLYNSNVYQIYRDSKENIWVSTTGNGVYKYDGKQFINYQVNKDGSPFSKPIMTILEDSKGIIWLGCAGGLFRLDSDRIVNVTTNGPWE